MQQCSRCRGELGQEGRFNHTFGGLAHWACPQPAVWPPLNGVPQREFDPLIALRKLAMRAAFVGPEAQAHLQALMRIVSGEEDSPRNPKLSLHESVSAMGQPVQQQRRTSPKQAITRRTASPFFTPDGRHLARRPPLLPKFSHPSSDASGCRGPSRSQGVSAPESLT